jgi:hypothetical protein
MVIRMKIAALFITLLVAVPSFAAANRPAKVVARHDAARTSWAPQTLTGKIEMVDPSQRLVVVQTAGGVPFDLDIGRQTRIENGKGRVSFHDLDRDVNESVTVNFIPERIGDVATQIRLGGAS